jgi:hypothetical protein
MKQVEYIFKGTKPDWNKQSMSIATCKDISQLATEGHSKSVEYIAKLNIPYLPKKGKIEVVLGSSELLLPYFVLPKHFITFGFKTKKWTEELNAKLIECIGLDYFKANCLRIVIPLDRVYAADGSLTIGGKELHYLVNYYNLCIWKRKESDVVFFLKQQEK